MDSDDEKFAADAFAARLDREPGLAPSRLLYRLSLIAILVPLIEIALIWAAGRYYDHHFSNKDIRLLCLLIWLETMVIMAVVAISGRHGANQHRGADGRLRTYIPLNENRSAIEKWEQRTSRRLLYRICGAALGVPIICLLVILFYLNVHGVDAEAKVLKAIAPFLWAGGLIGAVIIALRSTKDRLLYSQHQSLNEEIVLEGVAENPDFPDESA